MFQCQKQLAKSILDDEYEDDDDIQIDTSTIHINDVDLIMDMFDELKDKPNNVKIPEHIKKRAIQRGLLDPNSKKRIKGFRDSLGKIIEEIKDLKKKKI